MTKHYPLFLMALRIGTSALGQTATDYYQLPARQPHAYSRVLARYGGAYTRDRWYVGLTGFVRTDRAQLDNSLGGLIGSNRVIRPGWGLVLGWTARERWTVEAGYTNSPAHSELVIDRGRFPYTYSYTSDNHSFLLRGKYMLLSTSGPWRRSGFWISGGMWLVPGSGASRGDLLMAGYAYRARAGEQIDTLRLTGQTQVSSRPTAIAELGAEYTVRLSNRLDLGLSARKLWGLSSAVDTDLQYRISSQATQYAQLKGAGSGMTYGLTLRYSFALNQKLASVWKSPGSRLAK